MKWNRYLNAQTAIIGATLVGKDSLIDNSVLVFADGVIQWVGTVEEWELTAPPDSCRIIDGSGLLLLPGFIDLHVHGGGGGDFMDAHPAAYERITAFHAHGGTTTMLATTVTADKEAIVRVLEAVGSYDNTRRHGARLAGVHLEGPFISPHWPGAQNPAYIVPPQLTWLQEWVSTYPDIIKLVTLAPETEGALEAIAFLTANDITTAAGHTNSTFQELKAAADAGLRHAVHTYNAMRGLHHREPGAVGAILLDERITAEVIADGHHVDPACIQLLTKLKGPERLVLITDAISAAGLPDGAYQLGGLDVTLQGGIARLTEGGALAGSTLTMLEAYRYMVQTVGLSLPHASQAASFNPAQIIGLDRYTGSLEAGKWADLLLLTPQLTLSRSWLQGVEQLM